MFTIKSPKSTLFSKATKTEFPMYICYVEVVKRRRRGGGGTWGGGELWGGKNKLTLVDFGRLWLWGYVSNKVLFQYMCLYAPACMHHVNVFSHVTISFFLSSKLTLLYDLYPTIDGHVISAIKTSRSIPFSRRSDIIRAIP